LFAGVAPATASRTGRIRWGTAHRPFARLQASWLAAVLDGLESDVRLRPHVMVRANNLLVERSEKLVLEYRAATTDPAGAPTHLRIKATGMIRTALALAAEPIRWADLTGKLTAECGAPQEGAQRLVGQMVTQRLLLTSLRPPSTETDPLAHRLLLVTRTGAGWRAEIWSHLMTGIAAYSRGTPLRSPDRRWTPSGPDDAFGSIGP